MAAFVGTLADVVHNRGNRVEYDTDGCLVVGPVNMAIISLSNIDPTFYIRYPSTGQQVLKALPSLLMWMEITSRWLKMCKEGPNKLVLIREQLFNAMGRAVPVMASIGKEGIEFIKEKQVHNLVIDFWVQLYGASVKEEEAAAYAVMKCREVLLADTDDPLEFSKYFADRCKNRFDLDGSEVVKIAKHRITRSLSPSDSPIQEDRDFYLSLQLGVLSTITNASITIYQEFLKGNGIHDICSIMTYAFNNSLWSVAGHSVGILAGICFRTNGTSSIIAALKNKLIENLVYGTLHYASLERVAGMRLTGFIEQTLPEALIIRDVFVECGALQLDSTFRDKLTSHPILGERWKHLLVLYAERKHIFNTELPVRHDLRKCFNVRPL